MELQGKIALVTGASRGIGREIALRLGQRGASVALVARNGDALEAVAREIGESRALVVPADISDLDQVRQVAIKTASHFGRIDVLVNNAGVLGGRGFLQSDPNELAQAVDVNYRAAVVLTRLVAEGMAARRSGHIVNIASYAGVSGLPGLATYSGTKAALRLFTAALRPELGPHKIDLTDVVIGFTGTDMLDELDSNVIARRVYKRTQQLHLMPTISAAEVGAAVVRGIERRQEVLVVPGWTRFVYLPMEGVSRTIIRILAKGRG